MASTELLVITPAMMSTVWPAARSIDSSPVPIKALLVCLATIVSPGALGGANWPGGSYDPDTHNVYVYACNACLGPIGLAFCGTSSAADQVLIDQLLARSDGVPFGEAWLTEKGLVWAAELLLNDPPSLTRTAFDAANDNADRLFRPETEKMLATIHSVWPGKVKKPRPPKPT